MQSICDTIFFLTLIGSIRAKDINIYQSIGNIEVKEILRWLRNDTEGKGKEHHAEHRTPRSKTRVLRSRASIKESWKNWLIE